MNVKSGITVSGCILTKHFSCGQSRLEFVSLFDWCLPQHSKIFYVYDSCQRKWEESDQFPGETHDHPQIAANLPT